MNNIIIEKDNLDVLYTLKPNTNLTYIATKRINNRKFILEEGSNLNFIQINFLANDCNLEVILKGEGANFEAHTLTIGDYGNYNYKQMISHEAKHTNSNIINLAISLLSSKIKYDTTSHILNKMKKSNCRQLAKGIIISPESSIEAKPILLIDENDVYAYHGAAIGKMSDNELFYLMSRGLTKDEALNLLVGALINPVLKMLPENLKNDVSKEIEKRIKL